MNFAFDETQRELGDTVAKQLADLPRLLAPELAPGEDAACWSALAELGLFALGVPERFDGAGLSLVDLALAVEALGAGLAPPLVATTLAATDLIVRHGSEAQQQALLPRIAAGELKVAVAVAEADAGYAPETLGTTLKAGVLNGRKVLVAGAAEADVLLVVARGEKPCVVIVDPASAGVSIAAHEDIDPSCGHAAVTFQRVACEDDAVLGRSAPERAVERVFDVLATFAAGQMMGIAARMLDAAAEYARTRVQFGRPIGAFQAIKHRCADMAVAVEAGRSAGYYAFWALAEDAPDRARAASMAKAYCGTVARDVCNETIQVHGGMGFTWELGLHRFLRRAKVLQHAWGDATWHNERILAQTLAMAGQAEGRDRNAA